MELPDIDAVAERVHEMWRAERGEAAWGELPLAGKDAVRGIVWTVFAAIRWVEAK